MSTSGLQETPEHLCCVLRRDAFYCLRRPLPFLCPAFSRPSSHISSRQSLDSRNCKGCILTGRREWMASGGGETLPSLMHRGEGGQTLKNTNSLQKLLFPISFLSSSVSTLSSWAGRMRQEPPINFGNCLLNSAKVRKHFKLEVMDMRHWSACSHTKRKLRQNPFYYPLMQVSQPWRKRREELGVKIFWYSVTDI